MHLIRNLFYFISLLLYSASLFAFQISPYKKKVEEELLVKARQNIENYRKGTASLHFYDSSGKPLKNIEVEINQQTQDFLFGNLIEESVNTRLTQEEADRFRDRL